MRKMLLLIFVSISIVVLIIRFGTTPVLNLLGFKERSGLKIDTNAEAQVRIDNKDAGRTPFQKEDLLPGEHLISLISSQGNWQGYIKLNPGTLSVVNRELAPTEASSSGEVITLEKGAGVTIISNPSPSEVEVDGKGVGKTPLSLNSLEPGEHLFSLSHPSYLKRSVRAALTEGYQLTLRVDLAISEADLTQVSTPPIQANVTLKVLSTPTGFLRVRDAPSTSGKEITRVSPGDSLILIDEQGSWDKVKLSDGKEGYVSSQYVQKQSSP
jgi:hypothetical protein